MKKFPESSFPFCEKVKRLRGVFRSCFDLGSGSTMFGLTYPRVGNIAVCAHNAAPFTYPRLLPTVTFHYEVTTFS